MNKYKILRILLIISVLGGGRAALAFQMGIL